MSLPFLSTKSPEHLTAKRRKERKKSGRKPVYTPHRRRLVDMYRWHVNWYRRKDRGLEGTKVEMSLHEWIVMWEEMIPKLPLSFPLRGMKDKDNPYVPHLPAWMFRSNRALQRSQETIEALEARVVEPNGRNASTEALRRFREGMEARRRWKEEGMLSPAFKLQLKKIDINKSFRLGNVKLVCTEIGDKKLTRDRPDRKEQIIWEG